MFATVGALTMLASCGGTIPEQLSVHIVRSPGLLVLPQGRLVDRGATSVTPAE
jgi:hypothetical protein